MPEFTLDERSCMFQNLIIRPHGSVLFRTVWLTIWLIFISTGLTFKPAAAQDIEFTRPQMNEVLVGKKPEIVCHINVAYLSPSLFIALDKVDITGLARIRENGFVFEPFHPLPSGSHVLFVTFLDQNNQLHKEELQFTSRHSQNFEQLSSKNTISAVYTQMVHKMDDARNRTIPDWQLESNLYSENAIGNDPWQVSFKTNARYSDQDAGMSDPLEKGFYFSDYLLKGEIKSDAARWTAAAGDVQVSGTPRTIGSLSRRGLAFGAEAETFSVDAFSFKTQQTFADDSSEDVGTDSNDHLYGVSGGLKFFDKKMRISATYVNGGEDAASYNTWPAPGARKGEAAGIEMTTDFFSKQLMTRMEADWSDFDEDTSDSLGSETDIAYLAQANGTLGFFSYDLIHEHAGADYKVATASMQQDREGTAAKTGFAFGRQTLGFNLSRYQDNLDQSPEKPRIESIQYGLNYTCSELPSMPLSAVWQRSNQNSTLEPAGTSEIKNMTDVLTGSVSLIKGAFVVGLQPEFTVMDDQTTADYDAESKSLTLFSSYSAEKFSISPSVTANEFEDKNQSTRKDTVNCNLSFSVSPVKQLSLEGAASYSILNSSDDSVEQDDFSGDFQISYTWEKGIGWILSPALQLRVNHSNSSDKIADTSTKETIVYLVVSGSLDFSF